MNHNIKPFPQELKFFAKRAHFYNTVMSVISVNFAYAALGTEAPRFYAALGALFVIMLMNHHGKQYRRIYKLWREIEHPLVQVRVVWRSLLVALVGYGSLGLVASGILGKHGLAGF